MEEKGVIKLINQPYKAENRRERSETDGQLTCMNADGMMYRPQICDTQIHVNLSLFMHSMCKSVYLSSSFALISVLL